MRQIMIFVQFVSTLNWSIQRLKASYRFQQPSDFAQRPDTLSANGAIGREERGEWRQVWRAWCISAPASRSSRRQRGLGEDSVDESSSRSRRVEIRQVDLDEAPESMKHADKTSPMLPPFARRCSNFQRNPRCRVCIVTLLPVHRRKRLLLINQVWRGGARLK